jgi:hypothetical protein
VINDGVNTGCTLGVVVIGVGGGGGGKTTFPEDNALSERLNANSKKTNFFFVFILDYLFINLLYLFIEQHLELGM